MAKKYTVPNWSQKLLAKGIGLEPVGIVVEFENESTITFLRFKPRKFFMVNKKTGDVIES